MPPGKPKASGAKPKITQAMREYLKAAHRLSDKADALTVTSLAEARHVAPASATAMVKKLTGLGFLDHDHYGGIALTPMGVRQALLAIRRHRLLECFLVRMLHFGMDEVHDESELLEPAISDRMEARIDEVLGHPKRCPHGDPIPDINGIMSDDDKAIPLSELEEAQGATVLRVPGSQPELLRYLVSLGVEPERSIVLLKREPFGGPLHLKLGRKTILLGPEAAQTVFVNPQEN